MSIQRQKRIQSFPLETREYNPDRCFRMFSDMANIGDWCLVLAAGATGNTPTGTFEPLFLKTDKVASSLKLSLGIDAVANATTQVRDSLSGQSPALKGGVCEMDFVARVKLQRGASTQNTLTRIGFYDDSGVLPDCNNAVCFYHFASSDTTWKVAVYSNYNVVGGNPSGYKFQKDTGIPVSAWNTLSIWMSDDGQKSVFQIGDSVVHVQDGNLPNQATQTSSMRVGSSVLATTTTGGTGPTTLEIDYQQFRYFSNRGS